MFAPPLGQGPHRLSLEVDDKEIIAGNENLAQMVVAMDAGSFDVDLCRHQFGDLHQQIFATTKEAIRHFLRGMVQPRPSVALGVENEAYADANGLRPIDEVIRLKGLGCKSPVSGPGGERVV